MAICAELQRGKPTVQITTKDDFLGLFQANEVTTKISKIRELLKQSEEYKHAGMDAKAKECKGQAAQLKSSLPGIVFQCSTFKEHEWIDSKNVNHGVGRWRHQDQCVLNGLFMVDIDHVADPRALWKELMDKGLKSWNPVFGFVTPSGSGLKIVMPTDVSRGNLASHQAAFAKEFGVEVDEKCKDASRLSFVSSYDDIIIFTADLLTYSNEEFINKYQDKYSDGSSDQDLFESPADAQKSPEKTEGNEENLEVWVKSQIALIREKKEPEIIEEYEKKTYKGVKVVDLINAYFGGEAPKEGDRHDSLLRYAADLRHIVERLPKAVFYFCLKLPFVQDLVREGDPVVDTINDALGYKYTSFLPKTFSAALKAANAQKVASLNDQVTPDFIEKYYCPLNTLARSEVAL